MIPDSLLDRLNRRQCVAFVGAGFSMPCGMPNWRQLLENLLREARKCRIDARSDDLLEACEQAVKDANYGMAAGFLRDLMPPGDLDEVIRRQFGPQVFQRSTSEAQAITRRRMENLVKAPWAGIVTTNYDDLIEDGLRRYCTIDYLQAHGQDPRLGTILANASAGSLFFVKVHGTIFGSDIVLGTEEYDRVYMGSPSMISFLTALMLMYHIVFIGCSLEDELIRLRRNLCLSFQKLVPPAYALMPATRYNKTRMTWLRDRALVECIFYPEEDRQHSAVDQFLEKTATDSRQDAVVNPVLRTPPSHYRPDAVQSESTREDLLRMELPERLDSIGLINRSLLALIGRQPGNLLRHVDLLKLEKLADIDVSSSLASISPEERTYRLLFLASISLVREEKDSEGVRRYRLENPEVLKILDKS
jgi:hypothetical protein